MNTADYLLAEANDEAPAVITPSAQYSYGELRGACARLAGDLVAAGIGPADRVGILARNSLFWIAAYLAALKLGAVAVPFATTATTDDLAAQQQLADCRAMCVEAALARRRALALGACPQLITEAALAQSGSKAWPRTSATAGQGDAALMFTSGTTARPRAVRITHRNIQANTDSIIEYLELTHTERMMVVLPFHYCFGTSLLHTHLRVGATLVIADSYMYPEDVLGLMQVKACTGLAGVPSVYQTLLRNSSFPRRPLPALRKVQQAGGKLATVLIGELCAAVPHAQVFVMYGQTEATARLSCLPPALLASKLGSIGRGIPGVQLQVMAEIGAPAAPGQVGEIYAWGDNISPGYWRDPVATADKFIEGGALRTGDLATADEEGYLTIVDRKSDFIKTLGYRVSSQQVEACLLEMSDVVAAAVVGVPDLEQGEAIVACVTLRSGSQMRPSEIAAHCATRLAHHMIPKAVLLFDRLPVNSQGKVIKTELRRLATRSALAVSP
jgi:acyl-CoA synthetase (AMP-forming)/AMP-acid ligase II